MLTGSSVYAQAHAPAERVLPALAVVEQGSNVYLVGTGFHTASDTGTTGLNIVCAAPLYTGKVKFLFVDRNTYEYLPKQSLPNTSFAVLLRGEVTLPNSRRGIARLFTHREKIHGDEALLYRLQTKDLESVRFAQETIASTDGRATKTYLPDRAYMNPTEFAALRRQLNKFAQ